MERAAKTMAECPTSETLSAYALGKLPEDALRQVANHARHCPRCQLALEKVDREYDELIYYLRQHRPEDAAEVEPGLSRALQRAEAVASTVSVNLAEPPNRVRGRAAQWIFFIGILTVAVMLFAGGILGGLQLARQWGENPEPDTAASPVRTEVKTPPKIEPTPAPVANKPEPPAPKPTAADLPTGPVGEAFLRAVAALPAEGQAQAVGRKLVELNPGFHGQVHSAAAKENVVEDLGFTTDAVTDISPLRALPGLRTLRCRGSGPGKGKLSDLSPLKNLKLTHLRCQWNRIEDLSPLKGMALENLWCNCNNERDLQLLRSLKTLKRINGVSAPVFFKQRAPLIPDKP
jgi:anti-sigma factor RsiW